MSIRDTYGLGRLRSGAVASGCAVAAFAVAGGLGVGTAAAAGHTHASRHAKKALVTLNVGAPPIVEDGAFFTADSRGYFRKEGLDVKFHSLNGGATLVPAMKGGSIQIGMSNLVSVLQAKEHNLGFKCISGAFASPSGPEISLLISPKHKRTIRSPKALAGQTIAVNTLDNSNQLLAMAWLAHQGVNPSKVHFVALPFPDMPTALKSGRIAAAITDEPFTTISHAQGSAIMSAQPDSIIAAHPEYSCWMATTKWIGSNHRTAEAYVAALKMADDYMAKHPSYVRSIFHSYIPLSPALAKHVVLPIFNTKLSAAQVRDWATVAARYHVTSGVVSPSSILDVMPTAK